MTGHGRGRTGVRGFGADERGGGWGSDEHRRGGWVEGDAGEAEDEHRSGRGPRASDVGFGGSQRAGKCKNFVHEEERQLTRSVLAISQDPIVGNQQRGSSFWEQIFEHYKEHAPFGERPYRSLEMKWGIVKHDVASFVGCYKQTKAANKNGTSLEDLLRLAKALYVVKSAKNTEFMYVHCWELVRDYPHWADGWSTGTPKSTPSRDRHDVEAKVGTHGSSGLGFEGDTQMEANRRFSCRPQGTKAAKEVQKQGKQKEKIQHAQSRAAQVMAEASLKKLALLEDQNLLILMTNPQMVTADAEEYLRLRQGEELRKYRKWLAAEAQLDLEEEEDRVRERGKRIRLDRERAKEEELQREETEAQMRAHRRQNNAREDEQSPGGNWEATLEPRRSSYSSWVPLQQPLSRSLPSPPFSTRPHHSQGGSSNGEEDNNGEHGRYVYNDEISAALSGGHVGGCQQFEDQSFGNSRMGGDPNSQPLYEACAGQGGGGGFGGLQGQSNRMRAAPSQSRHAGTNSARFGGPLIHLGSAGFGFGEPGFCGRVSSNESSFREYVASMEPGFGASQGFSSTSGSVGGEQDVAIGLALNTGSFYQ